MKMWCKRHNRIRPTLVYTLLAAGLAAAVVLSFFIGRYSVSVSDFVGYLQWLFTGEKGAVTEAAAAVIGQIRFPRILSAVIVGAALAASGAAYQGVFRNPMVSPDILGATAGAGFGAALGILLSLPAVGVQLFSFAFGLLAVGLSYGISKAVGQRENVTLVLVLAGMVISSLFGAFISITKYLADPYSKLPEITFWLMGSLASVTNRDLLFVLIPFVLALTALLLLRWRLNVLAFGDEEAESLGMDTHSYRLAIIFCSTLLTASVVSISGQIGWVGLVIPHFGRMMVGPDYKRLLPATALLGGLYLLIVDNVARNLLPVEIPLGILTAVIGAPVFIALLLHGKRGWS